MAESSIRFDVRLANLKLDGRALQRELGQQKAREYMDRIAKTVAREVIDILPESNRVGTPHAKDNTFGTTKKGPGGVERASVLVNVPHATWLHNGTRAHRIDPRDPGGTLKFYWVNAGRRWIGRYPPPFGPKVHADHPGTRGLPFFQIACRRLGLPFRFTGGRFTR